MITARVENQTWSFSSFDFLYLSLVLMVLLAISFLLPIPPNDYWWYLRVGQETLRNGAIPVVDTFSYLRAGLPVVYHSWLSSIIFWLVFQAGGLPLTFLLRAFILLVTYSLVWMMVRQVGADLKSAVVLTLLSALAGANSWVIRPQLFTYALFALAALILWRWQKGRNDRLWLLPIISFFWVNLHGSFVVLFPLSGLALIFGQGQRRTLFNWGVISVIVTLLNPRGIAAWGYVTSMLGNPVLQSLDIEWKPAASDNWHMAIFFLWLLVFPLIVAISPRRLSRMEWAWFLGFGFLALSGVRYVVWFLFLLAPLTAILLAGVSGQQIQNPIRKAILILNIIFGCLFLLISLAFAPGVRGLWWRNVDVPLYVNTPVAATAWLKQHPELPGPLWTDFESSSYLIFALPERPVWIDSRMETYSLDQWQEYFAITRANPRWQSLLDSYQIKLLLLNNSSRDLILALQKSGVWCQPYEDKTHSIYIACSP